MPFIILLVLGFLALVLWGLSSLMAFVATFLSGALVGALVFGSVWFWLFVVAASCMLIWSIDDAIDDNERYVPAKAAPFVLFFTLLALQVFGDIQVFSHIRRFPLHSIGWLGVYIVAGVIYSIGRWYLFWSKRRRKFFERKNRFFSEYKTEIVDGLIPDGLREEWIQGVSLLSRKPRAREHRGRIIRWIAYWPWSMVWFAISDLVKEFFRNLFDVLHRWYQDIADQVWADVEKEVAKVIVAPPTPDEGDSLTPPRRR